MIASYTDNKNKIANILLLVAFLLAMGCSLLDHFYSKLELDLQSVSGNNSKLYWTNINVLPDESRAIVKSVDKKAGKQKHFTFHIGTTDYEILRLDPIDSSDKFVINKISLIRGLSYYEWSNREGFKEWVPLQNISRYKPGKHGVTITPVATDNSINIAFPTKEINFPLVALTLFFGILLLYRAQKSNFTLPLFLKRSLITLHVGWLTAYILALTYRSIAEFQGNYDYLFYHLPFALMNVNRTTYVPHDLLVSVYAGHPPLSHYIQGFFYLLTGNINSLQLNNPLAFGLMLLGVHFLKFPNFSFRWFLTALLSIPLLVIHYNSGLTDLIGGCMVCLSLAAVLKLSIESTLRPRTILICILACTSSMLIKFQTWPTIAIIVVLFTGLVLRKVLKDPTLSSKAIRSILLMGIGAAIWPVRNFILFGNPTYPFPMPIFPSLFSFGLSDAMLAYDNIRSATLPLQLKDHSNIYNFVYSALELSRWETTIPMKWTVDGGHLDGIKFAHHRLGGWFFLPVAAFVICLIASIFPKKLLPLEWLAAVVAAILLTASLPQSQELRYFLYIPIILAFVFAINVNQLPKLISALSKLVFTASMLWVMYKVPLYDLRTVFYGGMESAMTDEPRQFWARSLPEQDIVKICGKTPHTIFWAGPDLNTYKVKGCF